MLRISNYFLKLNATRWLVKSSVMIVFGIIFGYLMFPRILKMIMKTVRSFNFWMFD